MAADRIVDDTSKGLVEFKAIISQPRIGSRGLSRRR
jgi:hypothetical protein